MNDDGFSEAYRSEAYRSATVIRMVRNGSRSKHGSQKTPPAIQQCEPATKRAEALFIGGPPMGLQRRLRFIELSKDNAVTRAAMVVGISWVPLCAMTAGQDVAVHDGSFLSFLSDYGAQARYLIALPLLVLADVLCSTRLGLLMRQFRSSGLVWSDDMVRLDRAIGSTISLRDSFRIEMAVAVLAFVLAVILILKLPVNTLPAWSGSAGGFFAGYTAAGWWQALVGIPILTMLVLGWLWRLALWARLLVLIARLRLNLLASHPDRCGGLKFLGLSLQAYSFVAFGFGTIVAGTVAKRVMHDGIPFSDFHYVIGGFAVFVLVLFAGPLFAFSLKLAAARSTGILEYGALAQGVGREFENSWLYRGAPGANALHAQDFSATTDLYTITGNAYSMRVVPISLADIAVLFISALAPFLPVLLMSVPIDLIFEKILLLFTSLPTHIP